MFKSLQARLTLSYIVIILVCLVLVGIAALVLLRGYQQNLIYSRLTDRALLTANLTALSVRRDVPFQETIDRLARQMNRNAGPPFYIYLLDSEGKVVAGSNDKLNEQRLEELAIHTPVPPDWRRHGVHQLPSGERLFYAAAMVRIPAEGDQSSPHYVLLVAQPSQPIRTTLGDLFPRLIWAGAVALFLSIIVAALMAYSIARPLDRIAQAAEEIASGSYDQSLDISSPIEVARLATSFNTMAYQVKATLQSQQDLVANVSHDLKTPLTSIQGFSQALLDGTASDEAARERAATIIHDEADRMRRLVEELLDLARLEAGQIVLAREPVDLGELVRECTSRFDPQSERSGVTLDVEIEPDLPLIVGDADRLSQVFGNLVDNALRHVSSGTGEGRVVLRAEYQDSSVVCSVTDNGPGIPGEDLGRIFERFYQVDKSRARRKGGAGLGLAIAQEIVHAHDGQIKVESVEGLGTRFSVALPAHRE